MRAERDGATDRFGAKGRSGRAKAGNLNGTGCVKGVKEE